MSRTVTALYDTRAEAEAARRRLASTVDLGTARIIDRPGGLDDLHMSADDRQVYQEGIRRGAFVLTAEVRSHEEADKIIRIIEESTSLDLDARQALWRGEGWSSPPSSSPPSTPPGIVGSGLRAPTGMRETDRGGARVRSYLRDDGGFGGAPSRGRPAAELDLALDRVNAPHQPPVAAGLAGPGEQNQSRSAGDLYQPSAGVVISSAIAGAVLGGMIGGALPFLLAETDPRRTPNPRRSPSQPTTIPLSEDGRVRMIRR